MPEPDRVRHDTDTGLGGPLVDIRVSPGADVRTSHDGIGDVFRPVRCPYRVEPGRVPESKVDGGVGGLHGFPVVVRIHTPNSLAERKSVELASAWIGFVLT